jgi:DNA-binding NarL/FixJ family response regulator
MTRTVPPADLGDDPNTDDAQQVPVRRRRRIGGVATLDPREATIARMLVEGMDQRQVASELCIGTVALQACLARICAKLDIPSPAVLAGVIGKGTSLDFGPRRSEGRVADQGERLDRSRLSRQEAVVARLMRKGLDERQIAAELFIGVATVRSHQAHIQVKLGADVLARI